MTMPHKICPQCGQPAVLTMYQCRRCGLVYGSAPSAVPSSASAASASEIPRAQQAVQQRRRGPGPLFMAALALSVVLLGILGVQLTRAILDRAAFSRAGLSGSSALNTAPTDATKTPGKLSFFIESDSPQEMPVLTFRNFASSNMILTLRDRYGHVYRASSREAELATLQVPAGDYSVSIDSDNPRIRPNWGDAVFHKFKSYDANFTVGHSDTRIHLGD